MSLLTHKNILLGITGGIAAYKSVELTRRLREQGAHVKIVMTASATAFITPLTLQAVSEERVHVELLDVETEATINHIELARWADIILIAPTTANFIAKLTYGHADDLLSTVCLATVAPILLAPAMNQKMWQAPITQENCQRLQQRGVTFLGPTEGSQACGEVGPGRMLEPSEIVSRVRDFFTTGALQGRRVLVTAGPTREDIDPVRFISNRSSGRMGYAMAAAARDTGASVTLVSGPVSLTPPDHVEVKTIYCAQEMLETVMAEIKETDIFIAAAAVADYRPVRVVDHKIKKQNSSLILELERTPDILGQVASLPQPPFTVGFAAETQAVTEYARDKLQRKKLDMIAANQVGTPGIGFDSTDNALTVLWAEGEIELPRCSKQELAKQLMEVIIRRYHLKIK